MRHQNPPRAVQPQDLCFCQDQDSVTNRILYADTDYDSVLITMCFTLVKEQINILLIYIMESVCCLFKVKCVLVCFWTFQTKRTLPERLDYVLHMSLEVSCNA